jgi:Xaa-Pro aminopeptidase
MEVSVADWLKTNAKSGQRIGYDPWLMTRSQVRQIAKGLEVAGAELCPVDANPVDAVWPDRPEPPLAAVSEQRDEMAGKPAAEKIAEITRALSDKRADAAVLTDPASIAWLFNIRGADVPHTPLPLSFAIVDASGRPELFVDGRKLSNAIRDRLESSADVREPRDFTSRLGEIGRGGRKILVDPNGSAEAVARLVEAGGGTVVEGADPVALPKARRRPPSSRAVARRIFATASPCSASCGLSRQARRERSVRSTPRAGLKPSGPRRPQKREPNSPTSPSRRSPRPAPTVRSTTTG